MRIFRINLCFSVDYHYLSGYILFYLMILQPHEVQFSSSTTKYMKGLGMWNKLIFKQYVSYFFRQYADYYGSVSKINAPQIFRLLI